MRILRNVLDNTKTYSSNKFKMFQSSYFIHEIVVVFVILCCSSVSLAAQADSVIPNPQVSQTVPVNYPESDSTKETRELPTDFLNGLSESLPPAQKTFFGEDANGVPIVVGTWFRYASFTLATAVFGTAFLVACAASAVYYVLFVVTEPSQLRSAKDDMGWNVGRVLRAMQLAYETYETFDPYSPSCQLKTICEIQESGHFQGSLIKRMSHYLIHTDMVRKKMANAAELQAADRIGNDPEEECNDRFPECRFSINKLYDSYLML